MVILAYFTLNIYYVYTYTLQKCCVSFYLCFFSQPHNPISNNIHM